MRRMNILKNKISCKYLYKKRGRFLSTFKVLAGNLMYRQEKRPRYMWTLTRLFCTMFFYLQVSERFMNKQQTLLFLPRKRLGLARLRAKSNGKVSAKKTNCKIKSDAKAICKGKKQTNTLKYI